MPDPRDLEGADVRGDAHVHEVGYWDSTIEKRGIHPHVRVETLVDAFFVVWGTEFVITVIWLVNALTGASK